MAILSIEEIFEKSNYFENLIYEHPRVAFFIKDVNLIQEIEDILNSDDHSLFLNTYVSENYKNSPKKENDKINYWSRSGRINYAEDIVIGLHIEQKEFEKNINFYKTLFNNLFQNIQYKKDNDEIVITLKNFTLIYLSQFELKYIIDYFSILKNKRLLLLKTTLPLLDSILQLKNCVYLEEEIESV
jgi:hypothetical protein